jgi:hypothetical protein
MLDGRLKSLFMCWFMNTMTAARREWMKTGKRMAVECQ